MRQEEVARGQDEVGDTMAVPESLQHLADVMNKRLLPSSAGERVD